jgi:hypothetical protein
MTRGSFRHEVVMFALNVLPISWIQSITYKMGQKRLKLIRATQAEEKKKKL